MRTLLFGGAVAALAVSANARQSQPLEYRVVRWNQFTFHSVTVDLGSESVLPAVVHSPALVPFQDLVRDDEPAVAVTGTFFHPTSAYPVGDIVVEGRQTAEGHRGSVLAVNWLGEVSIFDTPFQTALDWSNYRFALRGAVRLIRNGVVAPDPRSQRFRDPRVWSRASRVAVGITADNRLALFATSQSVTLREIGKAMAQSGVRDAVNLDGGSSASMMYRGAMKVRPGRKLSNLFVVYERSPFLLPVGQ